MTTASFTDGEVEQLELKAYTEQAYLNYSMYVILDRALPHIGDGLKPVQRRIIYAMSELGLKASAKYKKSARTVGDVIGKFHPHGDSACYEAMVLMAQKFSYRYPVVDGQGNWGSSDDPKSFAAMRYTESKLTAFADTLLSELGLGTVRWQPNFDGTLQEPKTLPARLPTILLNGGSGIAVGMATDIPPHNLTEVANALVCLLEDPKATLDEVCRWLPAPDFPTEAEIITSKADIRQVYETGRGTLKMRATWIQDEGDIIITALPYQVSGAKIIEQIAEQMTKKKLPWVSDLRDESDHENPTRLVLVPRNAKMDTQPLMRHLCATTDLEKSIRINFNMVGLDGRPQVKSLQQVLLEWLDYRVLTVRNRLSFQLDKVNKRVHILEGLMVAFLNIDEVIEIIRQEDSPKDALIIAFGLSQEQANAILDLKLRQLAKLEEQKITAEKETLGEERYFLEKTLSSERRLNTLIKKEIIKDAKTHGDERRSPIVERFEAQAMKETDWVAADPVTVVMSQAGWIRAAKGHDLAVEKLQYKAGDEFLASVYTQSNQTITVIDSQGRSYSVPVYGLPSARGYGEPLSGRLNIPSGAKLITIMEGTDDEWVFFGSTLGYGFVSTFKDIATKNKSGKAIVNLPEGAQLLLPQKIAHLEKATLALVTGDGRLICIPVNQLPVLSKGKGNKLIQLASGDKDTVIDAVVLTEQEGLRIYSGKRCKQLSYRDLEHYRSERGRRGNKLPRGFQTVDYMEVDDQ